MKIKLYAIYTERETRKKDVIIFLKSLKEAKEIKKNAVDGTSKKNRYLISRIIKIKKVEFEL